MAVRYGSVEAPGLKTVLWQIEPNMHAAQINASGDQLSGVLRVHER
jgi:hypothetical protein